MPEGGTAQFGLSEVSMAALHGVLARHAAVLRADIYGSRAKGNFRPGSDIDLTLHGEALTLQDLLQIEGEIDDLLLPYRVDLSLHAQIEDASLRAHIARVGQLFYRAAAAGHAI